MNLEIGLSTAALYPSHLTEDALTTIAGLGFRTVEIFLQAEEEYTPTFGAELDRRRRDLGLRVHSLHLYAPYFDLWSPYPRMIQETRARFRRLLEIATTLEARALTWHGLRYGVDNPRLIAAFFESAAWAGEQAQTAGVTLCIENVSWCYLRTPDQVMAIRQADLPVGFTFDTFQAGESGTDPAALIRAMDSRLATVHLADYAPAGPRHLPPGEGTLDWPSILQALQAVGYDGPLILEPAHVENTTILLRARDFVQQALTNVALTENRTP
ncbi:MAG TPA: sugar phosphate isomerase/epimerase [Thermoflexia bacterium]|nr:sugar phosphate isomerase/epimerase [Thermoflexia bacterium]